ncbi:MAG: hypothetical protein MUC36_23920 [Planctomycetes bacterium]|nr:hypothetical protein [Planctomycetota bacterium]
MGSVPLVRLVCQLVLICAVAPNGSTQTIIVDANNGPGTAFTSIAAAVGAAPDGAVLSVRPGTYAPFVIDDKSLTILGGPGVVVSGVAGVVSVRNLASSRRVAMRGLAMTGVTAPSQLLFVNNSGLVTVEECVPAVGPGLVCSASQSRQLRVVNCVFRAAAAPVTLIDCNTTFVNMDFPLTNIFAAGLRVSGGSTDLVDCDVFGLDVPTAIPVQFMAPGTVRLLGATRLVNNASGSSTEFGATGPGIVIRDPGAQIVAGAPTPVGPGTTLIVRPMPALLASSAPLGGTQLASLAGPAGGIGGLFAGAPGPAIGSPPFSGSWFVDPATLIPMAGGSFLGALVGSYSVPVSPSLAGTSIAWQGWSLDPVGGWQFSNPVVVVHW